MDVIKTILIITIGVIAYYLLLQWPSVSDDQRVYTETQPTEDISINGSEDLLSPMESPNKSSSLNSIEPLQKKIYSNQIVVENDVLKLTIDGASGRIITSDLKDIKTEKGGDIPFQIFGNMRDKDDQNKVNSYFANSGFFTASKGYLKPDYSLTNSYSDESGLTVFELEGLGDGLKYKRIITMQEGLYSVVLEDTVEGFLEDAQIEVTPYVVIERGDQQTEEGGLAYTYLGPVFSTTNERFEKYDFDDIDDEFFKESSQGGWVSLLQHYFVSAWVPEQEGSYLYQGRKSTNTGRYSVGYTGTSQPLSVYSQLIRQKNTLYVGPKLPNQLKEVHPDLDLVVDYGFLWWMGKPMYWLLNAGHDLFKNWGLAIIFLTILLKILTWPLSAAAYKSMGKMRLLQPKMIALQAQHGDDKQKQGQAMMEFYKKEGVNPLGGCLPMLVQMPFFLAFYWVLMETVELRHSPFIFWIDDLSVKDPWFVLPLLNAAGMYFSQKLTPTPANADPMQAQMMKYFPLVFALIFAWFPAGLVLYWLFNMLVTLIQQTWYYRKVARSTQ